MNPTSIEIIGTVIFVLAIFHTFTVKQFANYAQRFSEGSVGENFFHFLAEVEVVFGLWAAILFLFYSFIHGFAIYDHQHRLIGGALHYLEQQNFTEPVFVFVIMAMSGTRPMILLAEKLIQGAAKLFPLPPKMSFYCATLILGPLLGSFITEPAGMTVTALVLLNNFFDHSMSEKFKYATLGLLFVNVSIGGTLTPFAAPPVLMVAGKWNWDFAFMLSNFGYKSVLSILISTLVTAYVFRRELLGPWEMMRNPDNKMAPTWWINILHLIFLGLVVWQAHHLVFFMAVFLFFLGFITVTQEYQEELKLKQSLMVGFFLGGLITLGSLQSWWLQHFLTQVGDLTLYFGATALTAITDNAALTYLGSLVELTDSAKYYLVSGAVIGGGLTVIANAPNPVGYGILKKTFQGGQISPFALFQAALFPTLVPLILFYFLPSLFYN